MGQQPYRTGAAANGMNRQRVIIAMTLAVFFMLGVPLTAIFGGLPPWPIIFWFAASHIFFCVLIIRTKPFTGPYREPYTDPALEKVERP
jgi:predicted MFS family arabinose efflux permease